MATSLIATKAPRRSPSRSRTRSNSIPTSADQVASRRKSSARKGTPGTRILVVAATSAQRGRIARGVAAELKRDLLRVDLGRITGKYIGETEKNLRTLFSSVEAKEGILFFDEADALFGRRTDVKDAHDRFANLETGYLMDRIERSPGVVLLATNSARKLDPAWMKRLRFGLKLTLPKSGRRH
jgi:SpoVK/Ycf46/Vps4 family AAA+-type ATPase